MNKWIENLIWMIIPLMASGVIYLFTTVNQLQKEVELLKSESALARLQMKVEIEQNILANRERIHELDKRIVVIEQGKK